MGWIIFFFRETSPSLNKLTEPTIAIGLVSS